MGNNDSRPWWECSFWAIPNGIESLILKILSDGKSILTLNLMEVLVTPRQVSRDRPPTSLRRRFSIR